MAACGHTADPSRVEKHGYPTEVGALFTTVSSIRVSRVSVMVSVRNSIK